MKMRRWIGTILAAAILLLAACGQNGEQTWQEQYELGMRYLSEGNYEEAIIAFTAAIDIDPKRPDAYVGLADTYVALDDLEKAMEVLELALQNIGANESIQNKMDEISPRDPLVISSVIYDGGLVGDVNGTPAAITIQYNCPDEETYFFSLELTNDGESVCRFLNDNSPYWPVNGSGSLDLETRLLLFETGGEGFQIEASLLRSASENSYQAVFDTSYSISETFDGIGIPDVPKYPGQDAVAGDSVLADLTLSGTLRLTSEVYRDYLDCLEQYEAYTSYGSKGSSAYMLQLDQPLRLEDGTQVEAVYLAFTSEFADVSDPGAFCESNLNQSVSVSGYLERQPGGMSGIVLVSGGLEPDAFWYAFKLPYTIVVQTGL